MSAALKIVETVKREERIHYGTAKNISEMIQNYRAERINQGGGEPAEEELEALKAAAYDLLANRIAVILGKMRKQVPSEELEQMLRDILK